MTAEGAVWSRLAVAKDAEIELRSYNWARTWKSGSRLFAGALAVSLFVHGWCFTLLLHAPVKAFGSVDVATSAISVNLETTDVLDATENAASSPASAMPTAVKKTKEKSEEAETSKAEEAVKPAEAEIEKAAQDEKNEKTRHEKAEQAASIGGTATTEAVEAPQSAGRVSASQGAILNYGASLRALISSNTPRNIRKASIRLAFAIAPAGALSSLSVLTSSGKPDVDRRMVDLVRSLSSRFPAPPAGASESQLTFNIEINFK